MNTKLRSEDETPLKLDIIVHTILLRKQFFVSNQVHSMRFNVSIALIL
jgi:hypothetical protein